jgi:thioredoxin 2
MSAEARHLVCPHCGGVNRVPEDKNAADARCGKCGGAVFSGRATPVSAASFEKHIQRNDIPVVVDFWAEWCGPCKAMAPAYEQVAGQMEPNYRFLKVDTEANPELSSRFRIQAIPTLMLFKSGKVVAQRAGASGGAALKAWIEANS